MGIWQRINQLWFYCAQKLLFTWVKTHVIGNHIEALGLKSDQPVIYAFSNASFSAQLVTDKEAQRAHLPVLNAPLTLGEHNEIRRSVHMNRLEGVALFKRYVPHQHPRLWRITQALQSLLATKDQSSEDPNKGHIEDIQIVPVSVFWGRAPAKEHSLSKLWFGDTWAVRGGLRTLFTIAFNGRNTFVQFDKPVSLRSVLVECGDIERTVRKVSRLMRVHFRHTRTAVIGPDLSHRRTLVHKLINKPLVIHAIEREIQTTGLTRELVEKKALKYGDEIASNQSHTTIRFLDILLTWVWNKIYSGVKIHNIHHLKDNHQDHELVYLPCHRSHIDYLLLSYVLYSEGFVPPQIAAGINLNLPIVGPILRRGGAFFMRRSFKDNQLYAAVFDEYLHSIFTQGYSTEYFVEGGRSRTGKTLTPRAGMLSMTVRSFLRDSSKPIVFIPIYIGYEKIFEASSYVGELRGKKKNKETVIGLIRTLRSLKKNFGQVYVNFGEPIHLKTFLDTHQPDWQNLEIDNQPRPQVLKETVNTLANQVVTHINQAVVINPINLISTVLLASPRHAMTEASLIEQMGMYQQLLIQHPYSKHMILPEGNASDWLSYSESLRAVNRIEHPMGDILSLDETNAIILSYFKNNIQHVFAVPSMLASFFVSNHQMNRQRILKLSQQFYPYLKAEMFLPWDESQIDVEINAWLSVFKQLGLLKEVNPGMFERHYINADEYVLLTSLAQSVLQILERYFITISTLIQAGSGKLTQSELVVKCTQMAKRIDILHSLNSPDFSEKSTYQNLIRLLIERDALSIEAPSGKLCFEELLKDVTQETQDLLDPVMRNSIVKTAYKGLEIHQSSNSDVA
jgi:glycerol-3-phosphate O-acyltransferase